MNEALLDKFLRYVKIDTQSIPGQSKVPSTDKQKVLSEKLAAELKAMGAADVKTDEHGYVYAAIRGNTSSKYVLGLISHVDTSSAVSGADVKPVITKNYDGGDIILKDGCVISPTDFPELARHKGKTIISADGTTLLGADDKAGVAEIMQLAEILLNDLSIPHCTVKIAFTPDEEVGRGTAFFDVENFAADGAYTVDGGELGELEYENFNAAAASVTVKGKSVHPGMAKGRMLNACTVLMELHSMLPVNENPMYTEGYEGFFHLDNFSGTVDSAKAEYIIRDFDFAEFTAKKKLFAECVSFLNAKYGAGTVTADISDSYYNMLEQIKPHMHLADNAVTAMKQAGIEPVIRAIRGGTDGATLSYKGLPCPNLFTGGYNFHGRYEYIPFEDMEKAVEVIVNLVKIYAEK